MSVNLKRIRVRKRNPNFELVTPVVLTIDSFNDAIKELSIYAIELFQKYIDAYNMNQNYNFDMQKNRLAYDELNREVMSKFSSLSESERVELESSKEIQGLKCSIQYLKDINHSYRLEMQQNKIYSKKIKNKLRVKYKFDIPKGFGVYC